MSSYKIIYISIDTIVFFEDCIRGAIMLSVVCWSQDLRNIFTLRTPEDAAQISALAEKGQKMIDAR